MSPAHVLHGSYSQMPLPSWQGSKSASVTACNASSISPNRDTSSTNTKLPVYLDLSAAIEEATSKDWDGYGAEPVDRLAIARSLEFIAVLPTQFACPEIAVDPQGDICFEWYARKGFVLSVCVDRTGKLFYAGIFGDMKTHGTADLNDQFPTLFVEFLKRVFEYA